MSTGIRKSSRLVQKAAKAALHESPPPVITKPKKTVVNAKQANKARRLTVTKPGPRNDVNTCKKQRLVKKKSELVNELGTDAITATRTERSILPKGGKTLKTKKRAAISEDANAAECEGKPKRPRKRAKVHGASTAAPKTNQPGQHSPEEKEAITTLVQPPHPVNPTDPCSLLPTEVWHKILSLLPLSQVARISVLSETWLDGSRSFAAWKAICQAANLGEPKKKYRSHMALVCVHSFWICDRCYSHKAGRERPSDIPLAMADDDDNGLIWSLCRDCRLQYYKKHPEPLRENDAGAYEFRMHKMPKTDAFYNYSFTETDLRDLHCDVRRNPYKRLGTPMRLYRTYELQKRALELHGGWIGVDCCKNKVARSRNRAFTIREKGRDPSAAKGKGKGKDDNKNKQGVDNAGVAEGNQNQDETSRANQDETNRQGQGTSREQLEDGSNVDNSIAGTNRCAALNAIAGDIAGPLAIENEVQNAIQVQV